MKVSQSKYAVALLIFCFTLLMWGPQYALRGFWEPDEARFVYVAREMLGTGSCFIPVRNGLVYAHKPPLMMWMIMMGERLFPEPFGARLPVLLGTFLSLLAVFNIARLFSSLKTAILAVAIMSGSWSFFMVCGRGQIDALLLGLQMSSIYLLLRNRNRPSNASVASAFLLMGLAMLAKGPVGLIIPLGAALCFSKLTHGEDDERLLTPRQLIAGVILALAVPCIWLVFAAISGADADYFREIVFSQNVSRAAGGYGHKRPFWYMVAMFIIGFMPWMLLVPGIIEGTRYSQNRRIINGFAAWLAFVILFFTLPASKRSVYIMMAYPAAAIILAMSWEQVRQHHFCIGAAKVALRTVPVAFLLLSIVASFDAKMSSKLGLGRFSHVLGMASPFVFLAGAILTAVPALISFREKYRGNACELFVAEVLLCFFSVGNLVLPEFNELKEPLAIRAVADLHIPPDGHLLLAHFNGEIHSLYARRIGIELRDDIDMLAAMRSEQHGVALFSRSNSYNLEERFPGMITAKGSYSMGRKNFTWVEFDASNGGEE